MYINKNQVPLLNSNVITISYRETTGISVGLYNWPLQTSGFFSPRFDLNPNHLYAFQSMSFSADIERQDYEAALDSTINGGPRFHLLRESEASTTILPLPIPLPSYFDNTGFDLWIRNNRTMGFEGTGLAPIAGMSPLVSGSALRGGNQFRGSFEGRLIQTPALVGKASITLIMRMTLLEIKDEKFAREYQLSRGDAK